VTQPTNAALSGEGGQQMEKALRELVAPLDRGLKYLFAAFGLLAVLGVPGGVYMVWLVSDGNWFAALFWGGGGVFLLLCVLILPCEDVLVQRAVRAFDRRFPEGGPERAPAVNMLAEMDSRHKAAAKLQAALTQVVRYPPADADADLASALDALGASQTAPPPSPPVLRSGGSYDYVPLEPRTPAEEKQE
jgi:hypothetical protein